MKELAVLLLVIVVACGIAIGFKTATEDQWEITTWDVSGKTVETRWISGTSGPQDFLIENPNAKVLKIRYEDRE